MSIQVGTGSALFCTTCGTRLVHGACPTPHAEPDRAVDLSGAMGCPPPAPAVGRTPPALQAKNDAPLVPFVPSQDEKLAWWSLSKRKRTVAAVFGAGVVVALVVALVVVALLWSQVGSLRGRLHQLQGTEKNAAVTDRNAAVAVDHRIAAVNAATNGLASRVSALETKANAQPDLAAVAKKVWASPRSVEASTMR